MKDESHGTSAMLAENTGAAPSWSFILGDL